MPRTIDEGFRNFLSKLTPSLNESQAAKNHRSSIEDCLKANFRLCRFFRTGSFGNGTSISGYSDVDYFAYISDGKLNSNSSRALTQLKEVLNRRFPRTNVHVDCPAVVCPFGSDAKESTEITSAIYSGKNSTYPTYKIPDCLGGGGWMLSSPETHNAYVREVDQQFNGKLKSLIRFIKAWKYYQNVPISSFYLELRIAKYAQGEKTIVYDIDVKRVFSHLYSVELANMQDPMGISGYISPCSTEAKFNDALSKLSTALKRSQNALEAKNKGDIKKAFYWWNLVYDNRFTNS
ncbi:nucleotidyltransferase [Moorena sp. SIO4G3]|uniref:nucleotidyltransferase domain-containing protein n=1 Tax=Moorena sp. SIO4G3 TaxID=2607821 RepID=UPI00142AF77C|nr:nucleotidyltransferase [Moorena sp. SIO4G3]NEO79111.1 nucleotidyltransferase [Moorena sp. SIO4G3]